MGTEANQLLCPNVEVIGEGPCLSYPQKCSLIAHITDQEVIYAIAGMASVPLWY